MVESQSKESETILLADGKEDQMLYPLLTRPVDLDVIIWLYPDIYLLLTMM